MEAEMTLFTKQLERTNNDIRELAKFLKLQGLDEDEIVEILPKLRDDLEASLFRNALDNEKLNSKLDANQEGNEVSELDKELNRYIQDAWKIFGQGENESISSITADIDDQKWQLESDTVWSILQPAIKDKDKIESHLDELLGQVIEKRRRHQPPIISAEKTIRDRGPYLVSSEKPDTLQLEPVPRSKG